MNSQLYIGTVMHQRQDHHAYRFSYKVFNLLLDLDELPALTRRLRLFSHNRFNLFSIDDRDHGPRDGSPLRPWAEQYLRRHGIELEGGRIRLLCFPRLLGYVFNPLSVWYCEHQDGSLRAVICEVRNTFGEMHHYLLTAPDKGPMDWRAEYRARKVFHVSPFIAPDMEYRFHLQEPGKWLRFYISEYEMQGRIEREPEQAGSTEVSPGLYRTHRVVKPQDGVLQSIGATPSAERERGSDVTMFKACISAIRAPFTDARLLGVALALPLLPFKVMAAIHWQALKLWLRGAKFHRMPQHGLYTERVTRP